LLLLSKVIRWGGLAAVLGGVLFIIADLATLVFAAQGVVGVALFRIVVGSVAGVLLLLGLVGLYARQAEALGVFGLVSFLVAFFGLALAQQNLLWTSVLANLGFILFGASCLVAGAYPRAAVIVLVIGALLSGVINTLARGGAFAGSAGFGVVALVVDIIFQGAVVWLGISLYTGGGEEGQRAVQAS
jgi:hypothetical protein